MFKNILKHSSIVAIVIVALVTSVLVGCQKEAEDEIGIMETGDSKVISTWQKQIDYVLNGLGGRKICASRFTLSPL
jgi:hypothetical protein